jgi:S1-C subfamily serine protease
VGNIFGSERLLPAVAELPTTAVAKTGDRGGLIVDPLSGQGDTGGSGAGTSYGSASSNQSSTSSQVPFSSTPGKTSTTTIVIAAVSAVVLSVLAALLIVKFVPPVRDFVATSQPQLASALGIETATPTIVAPIAHGNGSKDDAANTIYQQARNSVVTLKVVSKAYLLTFEGDPLPDVNGHKIYAGKDQDDNVHFYKNGKPVSHADGELIISKVKVAYSVGFKNGNLVMELFKPGTTEILMIKGHPAIISKGVELSGVTTEVTGTGFYVRPDVVCTNFGVVANPRLNTVTKWIGGDAQIGNSNAKIELDSPPIIVDEKHDLALLNVPSPLSSPLKLNTDLSQLQPGQKVYALGAPQGYDLSLAPGVVSSDRLRDGINLAEGTDKLYIQHSAKIDAGNNGGPLFNDKGEVIGVNADYVGNGSINLAVAGKYVTDLLDQPDIQKKIEDINKARTPDLGK